MYLQQPVKCKCAHNGQLLQRHRRVVVLTPYGTRNFFKMIFALILLVRVLCTIHKVYSRKQYFCFAFSSRLYNFCYISLFIALKRHKYLSIYIVKITRNNRGTHEETSQLLRWETCSVLAFAKLTTVIDRRAQ